MKIKRNLFKNISFIFAFVLLFLFSTVIQGYADIDEEYKFSKEELTQMLAPIALYPDSLLSQILMASTYPVEIVEAERWLNKNKNLKDDALSRALLEKDWDTSIKSLCIFKDILFSLSEELEQTRKLGDAFLSQEEEVMGVIQELRWIAHKRGTLKETKEQKVVVQKEYIMIEPVNPQIIYVPIYDPLYVYGSWMYPAYTPYYWYRPYTRIVAVKHIYFRRPVTISVGLFTWTWFDWPSLRIYISRERAQRYHRRYRPHTPPTFSWRHNPSHRRGVTYINRVTRERFEDRGSITNRNKRQESLFIRREEERRVNPGVNINNNGRFDRNQKERDVRTQALLPLSPAPENTTQTIKERPERENRIERERGGRTQITPTLNPAPENTTQTINQRPERDNRIERERGGRPQTLPSLNPAPQDTTQTINERPEREIRREDDRSQRERTSPPYSSPAPSIKTEPKNSGTRNQSNIFYSKDRIQKERSQGTSLGISTPLKNEQVFGLSERNTTKENFHFESSKLQNKVSDFLSSIAPPRNEISKKSNESIFSYPFKRK